MASQAMREIAQAETASPYATQLANEVWAKLIELSIELKDNRIDP